MSHLLFDDKELFTVRHLIENIAHILKIDRS